MELPLEIRAEIERLAAEERVGALSDSAAALSERYREKSGTGKPLVSGKRDIIAYAAVRMPATFGASYKALQLTLGCFDGEINSVLDAGAGTGAATHAANMLTQAERFLCLERDDNMLSLGRRLCEVRGIGAEWRKTDITAGIGEKADLVMSSYCLNELAAPQREKAVERLWGAAEKLLLIIEPGTPEGFSQLREARKQLIALGAEICAPCPAVGDCPMSGEDWCHFTARVARTRLHKQLKSGDVPYEDEKFCFIAAARGGAKPCNARVLRHPRIESGRITLRLCTNEGIADNMVTKKSPLFKQARKADSGDSFPNKT